MDVNNKKTRLEFLFDVFKKDYQRAIDRKLFNVLPKPDTTVEEYLNYSDPDFVTFYGETFLMQNRSLPGKFPAELIFNFFVENDPTQNKEYVNWFLNIYRLTLRERLSLKGGYTDFQIPIEDVTNFFEDLISKAKEALEVFTFLKKTNVLSVENRDINSFKTINSFVNMVKPYMITDEGDDSVHTLDHKELRCLHNFVEKNDASGNAELVFENEQWVIVVTHDRDANVEFGKYTTWCTAGTRWGNMFDSYHNRGELFVLIRKGYGSKKSIKSHPNYRLQFHFEDGAYMDANDKPISINDFLFNNKELKKFFRGYIVKTVLPKRQLKNNRQTDDIKYLLNLGFGDEIIKIFKDSKPEVVDFNGHKIESEYLEKIGEITSIKKLDLSDCGLTHLPESIRHLTNLKHFTFRNNKGLTQIPEWISELKSLESLNCAGCNISEIGDLGNNQNITELVLDFNPKLEALPKNIGKLSNLIRLTASSCDLKVIDDNLLNCDKLFLFDVHSNVNLTTIPLSLSKLPELEAICVDETKISQQTRQLMRENGNGRCCIIGYGGQ